MKRTQIPVVISGAIRATAREVEALVKAVVDGKVEIKHLGSFSIEPVAGAPIYVVTGIQWDDLSSRRWGWFPDREQAFGAVARNDGDLYENGYYPFVVIEKLSPGILPCAGENDRWWFVWDGDYATGGYRPTPCPTKYENTIGFGMG